MSLSCPQPCIITSLSVLGGQDFLGELCGLQDEVLNSFELDFSPCNLCHLELILKHLLQAPAHQLDPHVPDKMLAVFPRKS